MASHVRDLRLRSPITIKYTDSIQNAIDKMTTEKTHSVLVEPCSTNDSWRIFTTYEQFKAKTDGISETSPVGPYSSEILHFVTPDSSIRDCIAKMAIFRVFHLPVFTDTQKSNLMGLVSQEDVR